MRSSGSGSGRSRELLLFLDPILEPHTGPYLFDFQDLVEKFLPLVDGKDDLVYVPGHAEGVVERIDLVISIPKDYPDIRLEPKKGVVGRLMTAAELAAEYSTQLGFKTFGWTGSKVDPSIPFGVDISVRNA